MANNADRVESYIESIESDFKAISRLNIKNDSSINRVKRFKKLLIHSLLDAMSKSIYNGMKNNVKFIAFVDNFSDWKDKDKISFPHLKRNFELNKRNEYINLKKFINEFYYDHEGYKISDDPEYEKLKSIYQKDIPNLKNKSFYKNFERYQHKHLLYANRNNLTHELYEHSSAVEQNGYEEPLYMTLAGDSTLKLVYPLKFYEDLCDTCIKNLKNHLLEKNINPYDGYTFGDYYYEDLNKENPA